MLLLSLPWRESPPVPICFKTRLCLRTQDMQLGTCVLSKCPSRCPQAPRHSHPLMSPSLAAASLGCGDRPRVPSDCCTPGLALATRHGLTRVLSKTFHLGQGRGIFPPVSTVGRWAVHPKCVWADRQPLADAGGRFGTSTPRFPRKTPNKRLGLV